MDAGDVLKGTFGCVQDAAPHINSIATHKWRAYINPVFGDRFRAPLILAFHEDDIEAVRKMMYEKCRRYFWVALTFEIDNDL